MARGERPPDNSCCSTAQLCGLEYLVDNSLVPYVDVAVWGPFHQRIIKRLKFTGRVLNENGVMESREVLGPPTILQWNACDRVMKVGFLMTDILDLGALDEHYDKTNE